MKQPVTVTLKEPVQFGSQTITEIVIQPLKGKHIRQLGGSTDFGTILDVASKASGQPPMVFDEMGAEDCTAVADAVTSFLPSGPQTGSKQ